jgi:enoyl-CoA hydratase/carnithine racemase
MSYETILLEKHGNVSVLTLNRPPANSVSYAMLGELEKALADVASDKDARMLVFTDAGDRCFCKVMEIAVSLYERAPLAARAIINASNAFLTMGIEEGLKAEASESKVCVASKDAIEGFTAFMQKRKSEFRGE